MTRYLLDTNIISDLVRHPQGAVYEAIGKVGEQSVCTSVIVAAELRYGAVKKGSAPLSERIEILLAVIPVASFEATADAEYGKLRASLEAQGSVIGGNDMLIAAHALALDAVLVTGNEREFRRIAGLSVENWLRS